MSLLAMLLICVSALGNDTQDAPPDPLGEAKAIMAQENWKAASNAFLKYLRKQPTSPQAAEATFWVGYCLVKEGDFEQAIQALRPFESSDAGGLAGDKWADDALLQLGHAYRGANERDLALASWKRLIDEYADSVWKTEALLNIVQLLYYDAADFAACVPYCEQVMKEVPDSGATWEIRYIGAFCLNATRRFDEAEQWMERHFDPANAVQEAWRTVLLAQRDLLEDRGDAAMDAIASLQNDFMDLDSDDWLDILLRTSFMLRQNNSREHARTMLVDAVPRLAGYAEDRLDPILDELAAAIGDGEREQFLDEIGRIADDLTMPPVVRVAFRERQVSGLCDGGKADAAAEVLRHTLEREQAEFLRVRAALLLGRVLVEDLNDRGAAIKLFEEILPTLKRRDFQHDVRTRLQELHPAGSAR
jgi:tetratricopeptide (TPR) repeat protein